MCQCSISNSIHSSLAFPIDSDEQMLTSAILSETVCQVNHGCVQVHFSNTHYSLSPSFLQSVSVAGIKRQREGQSEEEVSVFSISSHENGDLDVPLPWCDVGQYTPITSSLCERPDWAALEVPSNGCISLGNLPVSDLNEFKSADLVAVIACVKEHELLAQQGFATNGFGYGVLQSQDPKVDSVALVRQKVPAFDVLLTKVCNAFADRMHVSREKAFVRFVKIDSYSKEGLTGAHSLHTDTMILDTSRGVCSIFATENGRIAKGMTFFSGQTKNSCTGEELTHGAMSVQLGGVGVHGTGPIPEGMLRLAIIVDIITEENSIPQSVKFYIPRPTPFTVDSPFIIAPPGVLDSTAKLIKSSPKSKIQAYVDWLRWVARQKWRYLNMVESLRTITAEEQTQLDHWRAGLSAGGEYGTFFVLS